MRRMLLVTGATALLVVPAALAVTPKGGVELIGKTSLPTTGNCSSRIHAKVAPSGSKMNVQLPLLSCVGPPALKNVKISDGGKFSVSRSGLKNTGGNYAPTVWTLKISGTFTAPTKAKGTFSMTELDPDRGGGAVTKSGKQTFRLKFYK